MDCLLIKNFLHTESALVLFFLLNKVIHTVKSNSAVVADNSSSCVCVGKSCKNTCVACSLHCVCISSENACVVSCSVCELVLNFFRKLIAVCVTSLNCVSEACERRNTSFKRLISLQAYDNVRVLVNNITRLV